MLWQFAVLTVDAQTGFYSFKKREGEKDKKINTLTGKNCFFKSLLSNFQFYMKIIGDLLAFK